MRDAGNPWVFPEAGPAWDGVRFVAFSGSPEADHAVDITESFGAGVESLACHELYLGNLGGEMADPAEFLRGEAQRAGADFGVIYAATFEIIG